MIPKVIHYCWYGRGQLSSVMEMCIASWRKYCPNYIIKRWDEDNSPMDIPWVRDAYKHQKYAFVADYMRFYALYHEGGVYMDTDMLLIQPIDELLNDKAFLGREGELYASMGIIGSEPKSDFSKMCLDLYNKSKFDFVEPQVIPRLITPYLKKYGFVEGDFTQRLENGLVLYKIDCFYPTPKEGPFIIGNAREYATSNTYGIHLWTYSWADELSILRHGEMKKGFHMVWLRVKRTPFLPFGYWIKVIKACLSSTRLGMKYKKHKVMKNSSNAF